MYDSGGLAFIRHKDWLGSSRLATTWAHAVYSKEAYAPFGEPYNEAGTPDRSFTGQDQNTTQGIYDYLFRKYDPTAGRWLSPDPAGWSAVDPASPQSLNRYAYVQNDPMRAVDPNGLMPCYLPNGDISDIPTEGDCTNAGGFVLNVAQSINVSSNPSPPVPPPPPPPGCSDSYDCMLAYNNASGITTSYSWVQPANSASSGGATSNGRSGYESLFCLGDALKSNGLSLALDAVGLLPEGAVAGAFSLWHGAAGVSNGIKNVQAVKMGAGIIGAASAGNDGNGYGTLVGTASIGASLAKAAPIYGQVLSGLSLAGDAYKINNETNACVASGKYD